MRVFLLLLCGSCMLMSANCKKDAVFTPFYEANIDGGGYNFLYGIKVVKFDDVAGSHLRIAGASNLPGINQISITVGLSDTTDPAKYIGMYSASDRRDQVVLSVMTDTSTAPFIGVSPMSDSLIDAVGITDHIPVKLEITASTSTYIRGSFSGDVFWNGIPGMPRKRVTISTFQAAY